MAFPIDEIFIEKSPGKAGHTDLVDVENDEQQGNGAQAESGEAQHGVAREGDQR